MKLFTSKRYQRVTNLSLAALLLVSTITASVPFIFSQKADAAPSVAYNATALNASDWTVDRAVPSGGWSVDATNGRVILNVNQAHANTSASFYQTEGVSKALPVNTDSIKGDLYVAADSNTKPSLRMGLWAVASNGTDSSYPIVEYANINGYTGWRIWNANDGTWNNVAATTNLGGQNAVEIVSNFNTGNYDFYVNNNKVYSYAANGYTTFTNVIFNNYNAATGDTAGNYSVIWKNISTGSLPRVATCTSTSTLETTYLSTWNTSETRATGHNELTADGLHIYTEGATSTDKVAGYKATDFALAGSGEPAVDYVSTVASKPGLQLVVDFNNDGTPDGTLVGESIYTGNDWWLTNSSAQFAKDAAPSHAGGFGSTNHGTLNAWLAAFPSARVKAVGYSLGSGVYGDGTIKSLTFGCVNYTFKNDTVAPVASFYQVQPPTATNGSFPTRLVVLNEGGIINKAIYFDAVIPANLCASDISDHVNLDATCNTASLSEGTHQLIGIVFDEAGHRTKVTSNTFIVDRTNPQFTVKGTPDTIGANGIYSKLSYSISDNTSVSGYKINDNPVQAVTPAKYSDINGITVGSYHGAHAGANTITLYDTAGNSTTRTFTLDNTKPTVTVKASPATIGANNIFKKLSLAVSDNTLVVGYKVNNNAYSALTPNANSDINDITVGSYHGAHSGFNTVTVYDVAGNSIDYNFYLDNTGPSVPTLVSPTPTDGAILGTGAFLLDWSDATDDFAGVAYYEYQAANTNTVNGSGELQNVIYKTIEHQGPLTESQVQASGTPDGTYYWQVRATDKVGNVSAWSAVGKVTVDTSAPNAPVVTAPALTKSSTVNVAWTTISDAVSYRLEVSNDPSFATLVVDQNYTTETSDTFTAGNDGTYYVRVSAKDAAGNQSAYGTKTVIVDTTPPTAELTAPANDATFGNGAVVPISGSTTGAVSYTLSIGKTDQAPLATSTGVEFTSYNWNTANVPTGSYIVTLKSTDAAGNSAISERIINIDNTAPALVIAPQTSTDGNQPTITGTVNDPSAVLTVSFNGATGIPVTNNNGTFSFATPAPLANGTYVFAITATDVNGNSATQSANVVVAVAAPAAAPNATTSTTTTVTPIITNPGSAVLGATTDNANASGSTDVKGATDDKTASAVNSDVNKGNIFGLAWYWWILILAALAAIAWFIIGAIRRRNEEEA